MSSPGSACPARSPDQQRIPDVLASHVAVLARCVGVLARHVIVLAATAAPAVEIKTGLGHTLFTRIDASAVEVSGS